MAARQIRPMGSKWIMIIRNELMTRRHRVESHSEHGWYGTSLVIQC